MVLLLNRVYYHYYYYCYIWYIGSKYFVQVTRHLLSSSNECKPARKAAKQYEIMRLSLKQQSIVRYGREIIRRSVKETQLEIKKQS